MNKENVQKAINVMQRVVDRGDQVFMMSFQGNALSEEGASVKTTEEELHACGTSACFSGWLAVSPEWKEFGGTVDLSGGAATISVALATEKDILTKAEVSEYDKELIEKGADTFPDLDTEIAIACFLGIPQKLAHRLVYPDKVFNIYNKNPVNVTAQDIIDVLEDIKEGYHVYYPKPRINE